MRCVQLECEYDTVIIGRSDLASTKVREPPVEYCKAGQARFCLSIGNSNRKLPWSTLYWI